MISRSSIMRKHSKNLPKIQMHISIRETRYTAKMSTNKASASYDDVLQSKAAENTRQNAYYNKGVAMIRQKKLEESIDAWKNALRLDPADSEARDNLIRALLEKKKQEKQEQQNKKDQKDKKQPEKQKQDKNQPENQPKPPQSKLTKQQVEQYLKSLEQREKDVQDKMNQNKTHSLSQPGQGLVRKVWKCGSVEVYWGFIVNLRKKALGIRL